MKITATAILILIAAMLSACGSDSDSPLNDSDGDPGPDPDGVNLTRFEIHTTESDGSERLRWVGNAYGPDPTSPEQSEQPWVGYGRRFRVNFVMKSIDTAVEGYQLRFGDCADQCDYWPRGDGDVDQFLAPTEWIFDPKTPLDEAASDCLEDPECVTGVFLPSGELVLKIRAIDNELNVITRDAGRIAIQVNYPPSVELREDGGGICDDDTAFPHYVLEPYGGGPAQICSIAMGDTIPVGAMVHMKLEGRDRLEGTSPDGSFCCDERADPGAPEMQFQGRLEMLPEHDRGVSDLLNTFFSPKDPADEQVFLAGPFDYTYQGRGRDEHGRAAEQDVTFSFVCGYPPRLLSIEPPDGARILLRDPSVLEPWPENEFEYSVESNLVRYWDPDSRRFLETELPGSIAMSGALFRLEPLWEGASDPRSPRPATDGAPVQYSGGVLSWAYEWFNDSDPENLRGDGPGSDDLGRFDAVPIINAWDTATDGGFTLFVPAAIWTQPGLFDCTAATPFCDMGAYLRARLGAITLLVRGRSTAANAVFEQCAPAPGEAVNCVDFTLERRGRYTEVAQRNFTFQLGLDADNDQELEAWPPLSAQKRPQLEAGELRLRMARARR